MVCFALYIPETHMDDDLRPKRVHVVSTKEDNRRRKHAF